MTSSMGIAVLGAGSWGTALAIQLARSGRPILLWGRDAEKLKATGHARENTVYLPGCRFPESLNVEPDLAIALQNTDDVLIVVPSHGLRDTCEAIAATGHVPARISWATKGLEPDTGKLAHEVVTEVLGKRPMAVLSGPTFAKEVGAGLPTAITVAGDADYADFMAAALHGERFRAYTSQDIVGVEIGGAAKNVIAIGAGMSDGLGFGANSRVALITRGLAEISRLAQALGADPKTLMGLAGMGDLVLTCTDNQSRNRRMGLALAAGKSQQDAHREIFQVVEGVSAAREVHHLAQKHDVEMPITEQIYRVLHEGVSPQQAVQNLFERDRKDESA